MAEMKGREQIKGCYGNARQRGTSELWREAFVLLILLQRDACVSV
jgi:hypothetical protein